MFNKILISSCLLTSYLLSSPTNTNNDLIFEESFLDAIEEATQIATKTKLNIDDVPAFVSILREDELKKFGYKNLYEALSSIPGVELSIEPSGAKELIFRGVKEKGKIKLLVDGVTINNTYRGSIYYYLNFPIELIKRIEIIRGPGAILYGSNAVSGVVNIITKKEGKQIFSTLGSEQYILGGFNSNYDLGESNITLNGYYQKEDKGIFTGPDRAGNYGDTNEDLKDYSLGVNYHYKNFNFLSRVKSSQEGTAYGTSNYLNKNNDKDGNENEVLFAQAQYTNEINQDISYDFKLGYSEYSQAFEASVLPHPVTGVDLILESDYKEKKYFSNLEFLINTFNKQQMLLGIGYEQSKPTSNMLSGYFEDTPEVPYIQSDTLLDTTKKRDILSMYINDIISVTDDIDTTLGVRYDKYSDFGEALSPKAAIVYRQNENLNFKLMYSKAFRAPSLVELYASIPGVSYGYDQLDKEESTTLEMGFIYNFYHTNTLRFNIFKTKIENVIYRDPSTRIYSQAGYQNFKGAELEFLSKLDDNSSLNTSFSYIQAKDQNSDDLANIANILANVKYLYEFDNGISLGTVAKYNGKRKREIDDVREDLDSSITIDQTLNFNYKHYSTTFSIKNLFDKDVYYPASAQTYENDYNREGRSFLVKFSMDF